MFRLANFDEESELYRYLSSIASDTIYKALDNWVSEDYDLKILYESQFEDLNLNDFFEGDLSEDIKVNNFFDGISEYISPEGLERWGDIDGVPVSDDGKVGMEIISRKVKRMKEKMADPKNYYTFDLFEEFLFYAMTDYYAMMAILEGMEAEGFDPEELDDEEEIEVEMEYETDDEEVLNTMQVLMDEYGLEEEEALAMTYAVYRPELMGYDEDDEDSMFFWDDDFALVFQGGFVPGIRQLVSGMGAALGYGYDNVRSIFTDIGLPAPVRLIGTEAGYELKGQVTMDIF